MRTILIYNIRYDLQQENLEDLYRVFFEDREQCDAYPKSLIILNTNITDAEELEQKLSDHITEVTGWCHKGFDYAFINHTSTD